MEDIAQNCYKVGVLLRKNYHMIACSCFYIQKCFLKAQSVYSIDYKDKEKYMLSTRIGKWGIQDI